MLFGEFVGDDAEHVEVEMEAEAPERAAEVDFDG